MISSGSCRIGVDPPIAARGKKYTLIVSSSNTASVAVTPESPQSTAMPVGARGPTGKSSAICPRRMLCRRVAASRGTRHQTWTTSASTAAPARITRSVLAATVLQGSVTPAITTIALARAIAASCLSFRLRSRFVSGSPQATARGDPSTRVRTAHEQRQRRTPLEPGHCRLSRD